MKRSHHDSGENQDSASRRKRQHVSKSLVPSDIVRFQWNSSDEERPIIQKNVSIDTKEVFDKAYESCQITFHESLNRMLFHLRSLRIKVAKPNKDAMNTDPRHLDNTYVTELLNTPNNQMISLYSKDHFDSFVYLKGQMFLYALCQLFSCKVYLFSTRSKATIIQPSSGQDTDVPSFYVLKHTDSYLQKTIYFSLEVCNESHRNNVSQVQTQVTSSLVAIKRGEDEKKPRSKNAKIGNVLDDVIVSCIDNEVNRLYDAKWRKFKEKEGKNHENFDDLIESFKITLPQKSFPNGLVKDVQVKIENSIKNNEFENFKDTDKPKSATWFLNKVSRMKKDGKIKEISQFVDDFILTLRSENSDQTTVDGSEDRVFSDENNQEFIKEANDLDVGSTESEQIRAVSRTLKSVINNKFCYSSLLVKLEKLQNDCTFSIFGLSRALALLINLILSGEVLQDPNYQKTYLNCSNLDFSGDSIFVNEPDIVVWKNDALEILKKEKLFTYEGFWKILSFCVGRKNTKNKNYPILDKVTAKMDTNDFYDFITTPSLQAACNQYFVNFSNMWSIDKYQQDLKVVITLLLRINLARKRFFKEKKSHATKDKKKVKKKSKFRTKLLFNIFKILVKIDNGKQEKIPVLEKMIGSLFAPHDHAEQIPRMVDNEKDDQDQGESKDMDDDNESTEEDDNEEEDLLNLELTLPLEDNEERDLTRKELNALTSVATMLCGASNIEGEVAPDYVKKQLYLDKQETISNQALVVCSKVINFVRKISLKKNDEASFLACYPTRHLRNILVKFADKRTKFTERRLFPEKDDNSSLSVLINHSTLYRIFQSEYNMFDAEQNPFTSYQGIQTNEQKESIFANFFDWEKVQRILQERQLIPSYLFSFNNQYDLIFYGKRYITQEKTKCDKEVSQEETLTKPSRSEIKSLNDKIKMDKAEYRKLSTRLKVEETERMNLGRRFRLKERKEHIWDDELYLLLKNKRRDCDDIYDSLQKLNTRIKANQSHMYLLNKSISGQEVKNNSKKLSASSKLLSQIEKGNVLVQGIDPGIVTTASVNCTTSSTLFHSINRFQCLEVEDSNIYEHGYTSENQDFNYELTAARVNQAVMSTSHRSQREKKGKMGEKTAKKKLSQKKITRKIRTNRFYKNYFSEKRDMIFQHNDVKKQEGCLLNFLGNWSMIGNYIRGHTRRSLKPAVCRLKAVEKDGFYVVDEFKSTITCNSCFRTTTKQVVRVDENKKRRIKGAVVCNNKSCPRRLKSKSTTINRDQNGAKNIALIGFSQMVSSDGSVLPPFRRGYDSSKYNLSNFLSTRLVTGGFPL